MNNLRLAPRLIARIALVISLLTLGLAACAEPLLRCQVSYAGTTHVVEARPVADPYPVASVDIGGRFRFKAIMVGDAIRVERVLLYAYLETRKQPVLIQQAKYLPPYQTSVTPYLLTGEQHLYGGPVERELIYSCTLQGVAP